MDREQAVAWAEYAMIRWSVRLGIVAALMLACGLMYGCPKYRVWQQGLEGEAELRRAEQNRKVAIQEAEAKKESASLLAAAEVERAKGVAEANRIIGDGLKGNEEYLRYLWIHSLEVTAALGDKVIYVPTEANLPILEATRLNRPDRPQPKEKSDKK